MNRIEQKVEEFNRKNYRERKDYNDYVSAVRDEIYKYTLETSKKEFLNGIINSLKRKLNKHLNSGDCSATIPGTCIIEKYITNILDFLYEDLEYLQIDLESDAINTISIDKKLNEILDRIRKLEMGQEIIYNDFLAEWEDIREAIELGNISQASNKLRDMVNSGIISNAIALIISQFIPSLVYP